MPKSINKYIRVFFSFISTSIAKELEYKINFIIEIISVVGNLLGSLFVLSLFYSFGSDLGGWSWTNSVIVLGIYMILEGVTTTLLHPNLSRIVKHVQDGTLDYVLLKPVNSQFWLSFRIISPWGIPSLLSGITLIIWSLLRNNYELISLNIILVLLSFICSVLILYSLWFLLATTSIWFVKVWNANEVLRSILVAGRYPISAYPSALRFVFTFIIPITFLTTVPAKSILGNLSYKTSFYSFIIAFLMLFITNLFWRFALRFYTSASS